MFRVTVKQKITVPDVSYFDDRVLTKKANDLQKVYTDVAMEAIRLFPVTPQLIETYPIFKDKERVKQAYVSAIETEVSRVDHSVLLKVSRKKLVDGGLPADFFRLLEYGSGNFSGSPHLRPLLTRIRIGAL